MLKNVWSKKPDSASAAPSTMHEMMRGRRISQMIWLDMLWLGPAASACSASSGGISTLPMHRFAKNSANVAMASTMRVAAKRPALPVLS